MVILLAKGPGDRDSILGQVIPKIFKIVLDSSLLNTQHYNIRIKGKWDNPEKKLTPSSTPRFCSY